MFLPRAIFVACTAFATLVACSLQGNVVCYADGGRHLAVEASHRATTNALHHEVHDASCHSEPGHVPEHDSCTDVSAEFSVTREASSRHASVPHIEFTPSTLFPLAASAGSQDLPCVAAAADGHPPGPPAISCLRTIILLV